MRIALLSTSWFDFYVLEIARALAPRHELLVVIDQHDTLFEQTHGLRAKIVRIPWEATRKKPLSNVAAIRRILKEIDAFEPDAVHFQEHDPRLPLLLPFLSRYGIVLDLHNVEPLPGVEHPIRDWLRDKSRKRIDAFVVHGHAMVKSLRNRFGLDDKSVYQIPFGRFSSFGSGAREPQEFPTILFFGRVEPYKGIATLVDAVPIVEREYGPDFRVRIVGAGDVASCFAGKIPDARYEIVNERVKDASHWFRTSDIVVQPYHEASVSGVTPVAYAYEIPVIVSDTGALPEVVDEGVTGLVVPRKDPAALAAAITQLLRDGDARRRMGAAGRAKLDGELDWTRNIHQVESAYQHAARKHSR